jgi:hypothetical protein
VKLKFESVVFVIAGVAIVTIGIVMSSSQDPQAYRNAIENARMQGPRNLQELGAPGTATPVGEVETKEVHLRAGHTRLKFARQFEATGTIDDAIAYYRGRLEPKGWRFVDHDLPTLRFEREQWTFELQRDTWSEGTHPDYKFTARLVWQE